jgi:hypothetical protein
MPGAFGTGAGWPLPASPAPSDGAVSAAPPASSHVTSPQRGRSTARRLPSRNSLRPCRPLASRMPRPMAPRLAPISDHGQGRELRTKPGPLPLAAHPRSMPPRSESAFRRQVPVLRSSLALGASRPDRHRSRGFATAGPASDTCSRPAPKSEGARPVSHRLFAGARVPRAACRLLQPSRSTSTPSSRPVPGARCDGKPPRARWSSLFRGPVSRASPGQGSPGWLPRTPTATTARRLGFTPTRSTRAPRCRELVPCIARKKALQGGRALTVSSSERARRTRRTEARLVLEGRHPHRLAKAGASGCTRGAFRHEASRWLGRERARPIRLLGSSRWARRLCYRRPKEP